MTVGSLSWVGSAVAAHLSQVYHMAGGMPASTLGDMLEWAKDAARARPGFLRLPLLTCQAAGGDPTEAIPVAAAWHLFYCAAHLVDDVADHAELPIAPASAINAAFGLSFLGQFSLTTLGQSQIASERILTLVDLFNQAAIRVVEGQGIDLTWDAQDSTLEDYWRMIGAKAGEWFALACRAGALFGAQAHEIDIYGTFGYHLGVLIQLNDDLSALWKPRGPGDLATIDRTLPVVYGRLVAPTVTRERLVDLLPLVAVDTTALVELQSLLADLGAIHYLTLQAGHQYVLAREPILSLARPHPAHHELLTTLDSVFPAMAQGPWSTQSASLSKS